MKRQTRVRLLTMLLCFVLMFACALSACKDAVPTPNPDKTDTCTNHVDKDGDGKCDKCGADLVLRDDDKPETVNHRLEVYHEETEPLKDFYAQRGVLRMVDNQPTIEATTQVVLKALGL